MVTGICHFNLDIHISPTKAAMSVETKRPRHIVTQQVKYPPSTTVSTATSSAVLSAAESAATESSIKSKKDDRIKNEEEWN